VGKAKSLLCTGKEIADIYERHYEMLYRVCFMYMKNIADTEDAVQNTYSIGNGDQPAQYNSQRFTGRRSENKELIPKYRVNGYAGAHLYNYSHAGWLKYHACSSADG